jgi:hypothetical protein
LRRLFREAKGEMVMKLKDMTLGDLTIGICGGAVLLKLITLAIKWAPAYAKIDFRVILGWTFVAIVGISIVYLVFLALVICLENLKSLLTRKIRRQ